jgi:hypothetical protein
MSAMHRHLNPNAAEMPANASIVIPVKPVLDVIGEWESMPVSRRWIPVFTGMTGSHKMLIPENSNNRVRIHAHQGFGKFCK